jgi:RNA polymerase sigma-70 factor (ECF subfamily)
VTIALNTARAELRRRRSRRASLVDPDDAAAEETPTAEMTLPVETAMRLALASLARILTEVPPEERLMLVLRYVEEMELTEVAAASGVSLATVKRRLNKAASRILARAKRDAILTELLEIHAPAS